MIHLFGIGVGLVLNKPLGGRLSRVLGALIGVGGIYFLVPRSSLPDAPAGAFSAAQKWSGPAWPRSV